MREVTEYGFIGDKGNAILPANFYCHDIFSSFKPTYYVHNFSGFKITKFQITANAVFTPENLSDFVDQYLYRKEYRDPTELYLNSTFDVQEWPMSELVFLSYFSNRTNFDEWKPLSDKAQGTIDFSTVFKELKKKKITTGSKFKIYWYPKCRHYIKTSEWKPGTESAMLSKWGRLQPGRPALSQYYLMPGEEVNSFSSYAKASAVMVGYRLNYDFTASLGLKYVGRKGSLVSK